MAVVSKLLRYLKRKMDSLLFWIKNPASIHVEAYNPCSIKLGRGARVGIFGRLHVNEPQSGSSIVIGERAWLGRNVELQVWKNQKLTINHRATIQDFSKILGDVSIGAYSTLASNVFISSGTHEFMVRPARLVKIQDQECPIDNRPTKIEEDVWIGGNVFIKHGVTVGRGAIIGANSVVTKNVGPYEVCAGAPAKKIKSRLAFCPPSAIDAKIEEHRPYFYEGFDHEIEFAEGFRIVNTHATLTLDSKDTNKLLIGVHSNYNSSLTVEIAVGDFLKTFLVSKGSQVLDIGPIPMEKDFRKINITLKKMGKGDLYVSSAKFN